MTVVVILLSVSYTSLYKGLDVSTSKIRLTLHGLRKFLEMVLVESRMLWNFGCACENEITSKDKVVCWPF